MSSYTPSKWVVVRIKNNDFDINKVLAGWYGGYGGSDSWKLSSGIVSTEEFEDRYEFHNHSGSVYVCYKKLQGMTGYTSQIFSGWLEEVEKNNKEHPDNIASMEIVEY